MKKRYRYSIGTGAGNFETWSVWIDEEEFLEVCKNADIPQHIIAIEISEEMTRQEASIYLEKFK